MKTIIVYCHPYPHSFNHAILEAVCDNLKTKKVDFRIIDLYAEDFDPVYSKEELTLYHEGGTVDPLVKKYLALLKGADTIIFITPIWWNSIPGMLKGFIDKVMKEGENLSHTISKRGVKGGLTNIKHCYVLTTSTSPTLYIKYLNGNAVQRIFIKQTLKQLGFRHGHWQNFGLVSNSTQTRRENYLFRVRQQNFK